MKRILIASLALVAFNSAQAAGDAAAGKTKAALCAACHGPDGNTPIMETYPKIAGQNAAYIEASIKAYIAGERTGANAAVMLSMVSALSDQDIADLAAYFSSL